MNPTQTTFLAIDRIDGLRREASLQHPARRPRAPRSGGGFGRIAGLLSALRDRRRPVARYLAPAAGAEQLESPAELRTV